MHPSLKLGLLASHILLIMGCGSTGGFEATPTTLAADSAVRRALAVETSLDPATFPPRSVAVLPLRVDGLDPSLAPLGFGLAELLMSDLARSRQVQVVDRLRIHAVLRELALVNDGIVEVGAGPRPGRLLGARHLVLGSVAPSAPGSVLVDLDLVRTDDATVQPVVSGATTLDDVLDAETELALAVFEALGVTLTPAERAEVVRRPTRELGALLAFGQAAHAEAEGRLPAAIQGYRSAIRADPSFREPRERLNALEAYFPDVDGLAYLMIDGLNPPGRPEGSDIADPAFQSGRTALLVIPITIR